MGDQINDTPINRADVNLIEVLKKNCLLTLLNPTLLKLHHYSLALTECIKARVGLDLSMVGRQTRRRRAELLSNSLSDASALLKCGESPLRGTEPHFMFQWRPLDQN